MGSEAQNTTPPRSARQIFLDYVKKARHYYDKTVEIAEQYTSQVPKRFETQKIAEVAISEDYDYRLAVSNEQFMERLANMYGQVAMLDALHALVGEQRRTNDLLNQILQQR